MKNMDKLLMEAASLGEFQKVKHCLEAGCDSWVKDGKGWSALMWAAINGQEECVRLLLSVSDALIQDKNEMSALMWAARFGHETCVRLLLPQSDPLAKDSNGRSALMWVAWNGHANCVRLLLPKSDAMEVGHDGRSASQIARDWGYSAAADVIDAHIAQREADVLTGHVSSGPTQDPSRRKPASRL